MNQSPLPNPAGEELIGARAYRVVFAFISLPLAIAAVVYFIDHRYDGLPLWNVRHVVAHPSDSCDLFVRLSCTAC
jgi:uncharacterized membrane protein